MSDAARRPGDIAPGAMTEYLNDDWAFFIRSAREFEKFRSPFQAVEVHDSVPFGKLFRLDGHFMTSERDEFFYHENLVHPAALAHPKPERALIVGGGDAGGDRSRRRRHLPQVPAARASRQPRRSARVAAHRGRVRLRAQQHAAV